MERNYKFDTLVNTDGLILGTKNVRGKEHILSIDNKSLKKTAAVFGVSGSGKTKSFVKPQILQCVNRNESMIISDSNGELAADMSQFLINNGYTVRILDLSTAPSLLGCDSPFSDSWDFFSILDKDKSKISKEYMTHIFATVVVKNLFTRVSYTANLLYELNLLETLALLVISDNTIPRNTESILKLFFDNTEDDIDTKIGSLPNDSSVRSLWKIFKQLSQNKREDVWLDLAIKLHELNFAVHNLSNAGEKVDFTMMFEHKCAFFITNSDFESSTSCEILSSLFVSSALTTVLTYDKTEDTVPVNFVLDDFQHIGYIPDFAQKLDACRSQGISVVISFQDISQIDAMKYNREMLDHFDAQVFFGSLAYPTMEYVESRFSTNMEIDELGEIVNHDKHILSKIDNSVFTLDRFNTEQHMLYSVVKNNHVRCKKK